MSTAAVCIECGHDDDDHDWFHFCSHVYFRGEGRIVTCACNGFTLGQAILPGTGGYSWTTDEEVARDYR